MIFENGRESLPKTKMKLFASTSNMQKQQCFKYIAVFLFVIYAVVGLFLFNDYGCGPDEGMERQTALVNFKYAVRKLHIPISEKNKEWLAYLPDLKEYRDRYYGTALHFPLVIIESAYHFSLAPSQFYGMRHFYTFLNYYLSIICFYKLLSARFGDRKFGLIGMMMMILTPRFFAESFYNNKDIIFVAWYIICSWLIFRWFQKRNIISSIALAFSLALTCNTRLNGIVFLPIFVFLYLTDCLRDRKTEGLKLFILTLGMTALFFYLMTPNFWEDPLHTFLETLQFNMRHPNHGSDGNLFKGVLVDAAKIYTYIPTWVMITTPVVYLVFIFGGFTAFVVVTIRQLLKTGFRETNLTDAMMFISSYGAVAFIILTHVTIYNGWRHCYFAYPGFVYFGVYLLERIGRNRLRIVSKSSYAFLILSMAYNLFWIIENHPFEFVYFSPVIRESAGQFSGDYWSISTRALLEYIVQGEPFYVAKINHLHTQAGSINRGLLPEEKQQYIELTYDQDPLVHYYIVCRDDIESVDVIPDGYKKVYSIVVDNDEIAAVFKNEELIKLESLIQERTE